MEAITVPYSTTRWVLNTNSKTILIYKWQVPLEYNPSMMTLFLHPCLIIYKPTRLRAAFNNQLIIAPFQVFAITIPKRNSQQLSNQVHSKRIQSRSANRITKYTMVRKPLSASPTTTSLNKKSQTQILPQMKCIRTNQMRIVIS